LADTQNWQRWMAEDPRHSQAFRELEKLWEDFDALPAQPHATPAELTADRYDGSLPVSAWRRQQIPIFRGWNHPGRWAWAAVMLLTLTCIGFGGVLAPRLTSALSDGKTFDTAVGQNATVRLSDGSEVQLGGHTRLRVSLTAHLRQIDLLSGEAFFVVAKDPARPFTVRAGNATVTAVGTEFNVRRSDDRVTVSVLEGRVLIQPMAPLLPIAWLSPSRAVGSAKPLASGQRSTVTGHGTESIQSVSDTSSAVAWSQGRLAFEAEPLRYVVQDVNRYTDKPILIADDRTADLQVTGTVAESNILGWINSLQAAFGIHADIQSNQIVLRQQ
jgi:transmembrane sensor